MSSDTVQIGVEVYGPDSPPPTATATVTPTTTVTPSPIKPTPSVTPVQTPPSNPIPTAVPGQTPTVVAVRALPNTGTEPGVDMAPAMILVLSAGLVMSMAALAVQSRKRRA